ncbi:MAG: GntR family transcriptional regulator [Arthrobacter sp.]|uniref:GntR family transcriptional regulator n=1 Tax=unclassified Arthrobacter TaxID=235627 RepID=UPI00264C3DDC|nr:GntR family transcriptional regulator [Micrococcaceae bacterium]MDN5812383.1 GntR family transcriptional regulator [Micrococcaceae bacterium]MDN5823384.1 GntR family transcriptional regulator [Micrococcaceae bacterium]MDN5878373.1 GntR family transcriptional regulator [Micrococcaceae bacterium]MDN5885912.1 GntR family transcriptional regulator [Micrococcaceae bacterium]
MTPPVHEHDGAGSRHAHTGAWIAAVLRRRIAAGLLTPGSKLSEQKLSVELGVSRNTLREAFGTLVAESVVVRIPNRGVFVASPGAEDVREIYRVRRVIEPSAVLWGTPAERELEAMDAIVRRAAEARDAGSVPGMADANQALHQAVIALTGSQTLQVLMDRVLARMRLVFHTMSTTPDFHPHYVERNIGLVACLRAGRPEEAARMLRDGLDAAEGEILARIEARAPDPEVRHRAVPVTPIRNK